MNREFKQKLLCLTSSVLIGGTVLLNSSSVLAQSSADPNKVLRYAFPAAETGFDPVAVQDLYSAHVLNAIFETLYTYDYLALPLKLVPQTAAAMPEISADGKTYTIHLKKGIYFADDPVFKGKPRELTSYDYAYAIKRILDPNLRSPNNWMFDGKLQGLQPLIDQASKSGKFDYDQAVAGIETPDRYTLIFRLNHPDQNFGYILAHAPSSAVAKEVIEKYKDKSGYVMGHPVGTGPYLLSKWTPASRIILKANPKYRGFVWNFKASTAADQKIVSAMKGKRMPQIGTIDIRVMEEAQSRILAFQKDELDMFALDGGLVQQALDNGKLKPSLQKKGIGLSRISDPSIDYYYWNMKNPVVGGYSKEKIALRRAMSMAFDNPQQIKLIYNGDAKQLDYPIPFGIVGHDPNYKTSIPFSVKAANLLLDRYHYKVGADGWRTLPNGKPLVIEINTMSDSRGQQQAELWKKTLNPLKIQLVSKSMPFADMLKAEKQCQTMFRPSAWYADYPDGDNFMQLFYGKNIHATNNSCFSLPEYDRLYEQSTKLPAGPARDALYHKMARLLEVYSAVKVTNVRYRNVLTQPRVIGFKKSPMIASEWMYIDIQR